MKETTLMVSDQEDEDARPRPNLPVAVHSPGIGSVECGKAAIRVQL